MESRLKFKINNAQKAFKTFEDILKEPYSLIVRDAAIQRFEYTSEVIWKLLKEILKEDAGIISNSPKLIFREAFSVGYLTEAETTLCLQMTNDRNETVHIYNEKVAASIFAALGEYCKIMKKIIELAKEKLSD